MQQQVASFAHACAYDRAGFGWSDAGPLPSTAGAIASELHTLLQRSGEPPPYTLVGHSFGALVMRIFAARHRDVTAGLVLVDPAHPEDWLDPSPEDRANIERGRRLCKQGARAARLGLARAVAALVNAGALSPARVLVKFVSRGGLHRPDESILAPMWKIPAEARRRLPLFLDATEVLRGAGGASRHDPYQCRRSVERINDLWRPAGHHKIVDESPVRETPASGCAGRADPRAARTSSRPTAVIGFPSTNPPPVVQAIREMLNM